MSNVPWISDAPEPTSDELVARIAAVQAAVAGAVAQIEMHQLVEAFWRAAAFRRKELEFRPRD